MRNGSDRKWYLTVLAGIYLALCSAGCLYYLSLLFRAQGGTVPVLQQGLCLAFAVAAGAYFFHARVGQVALTILTALTLIAIGTSDPKATAFHLNILLILAFSLIQTRKHTPPANS
jgi:hypothetical protein